jgi:2-keto-4-pentenoate hydratase/2-oxohepta-3-ene-1,7-dioic acid hydratase in catechol pathway
MKLCRFDHDRLGLVLGDEVADVTEALDSLPALRWPATHGAALVAGLGALRPRIEQLSAAAARRPLGGLRLDAPVADPARILGVRTNYPQPGEVPNAPAAGPEFFVKSSASLAGPHDGIDLRLPGRRCDHEIELAVVIGSRADRVAAAVAHEFIAGFCVGLDITLRGSEERGLRKSLDSFTLLGPWLTTAEEVPDPGELAIALEVNGEVRQSGSTREMRHGVRELVARASSYFALLPGDVILTGTPTGVGPLAPGDELRCTIERLGTMVTRVRR